MARYKQGQLEQAIRNLVYDIFINTFEEQNSARRARNRLEEEDSTGNYKTFVRGKRKGRVANPKRDRRLKQNRQEDTSRTE